MSANDDRQRGRVRIPADVEREDRLLANLTARQLAILGIAAVVLWASYLATRHAIPLAVFAALAFPFGAVALLLAIGRVEGLPADRLFVSAWRQLRAPRRLVPVPDGVAPTPSVVGIDGGPLPQPLHLPMAGVDGDGMVDLGSDGLAVVCRASSVTFSLRTPVEQESLVAGFARWLNSLSEPAQLLVRAEPIDLSPMVDALVDAAPSLPHPGLEAAAREHAAFLGALAARRTLLRREVLVVLRQPAGDGRLADSSAERLCRRAEETAAALAAAGVTLTILDGEAATACLVRAIDPTHRDRPAGTAPVDEVITGGAR